MAQVDLTLELPSDIVVASGVDTDHAASGHSSVDFASPDPVRDHDGDYALALESVRNEVDEIAYHVESPSNFRERHIHIHVLDRRYKAGKLAPVSQVVVSVVIYCMRWVLEEVVSAVPLNGGCYSAILNSSSKRLAAFSSIFSILSYLATGVVCGVAAFNYLNSLAAVPVVWSTVGMLFAFAVLCCMGIAESAAVALAFFLLHALTLSVLCVTSAVFIAQHPAVFAANMRTPLPDAPVLGTLVDGSVLSALFFGYGSAMLGVTGFESSAQFVEEQAPGVFPKTLRNMWACSSVYNIAFSLLALGVVPMTDIVAHKDVLLAHMGRLTAGHWLEVVVSVDAFVVLAGAVLTSYVGIVGLVQRLATDRVLPRVLTRTNQWRGTAHRIILVYFLVAASLVVAMDGKIDGLAGVFALAFLGVLGSFALGCILLKFTRRAMPRATVASWLNCAFCLLMLALAFLANALADPASLGYFVLYFAAIGLVVVVMLERVWVLKAVLELTKRFVEWRRGLASAGSHRHQQQRSQAEIIGSVAVAKMVEKIKRTPAVFFCKSPSLPRINAAIAYVLANEQTYCLRLVHVAAADAPVPPEFADVVCLFDHIYPLLKIDFVAVTGAVFDPAMVHWLVDHLKVPTNLMFMRQPTTPGTHAVAGEGVRVIAAD
ncbi:hypothetical protein PybrP1_007006 [[Pythium] brassicae (nom. inval.)]|nr:hypothetical protein PybrP1_007006 [[Pythium] brassicae (nom. inval.)]